MLNTVKPAGSHPSAAQQVAELTPFVREKPQPVLDAATVGASDTVNKLVAYLRSKATQGELEKAKRVLKKASCHGSLPGLGSISVEQVERAICILGGEAEAATQMVCAQSDGRETPNSTLHGRFDVDAVPKVAIAPKLLPQSSTCIRSDNSTIPKCWTVRHETAWRQAPRQESPLLGVLPVGRLVTEVCPSKVSAGWIAISPRGWVVHDALESHTSSTPPSSVPAKNGPLESRRQKRELSPSSQSWHRSTKLRAEPAAIEHVYVLDALNILNHRNNEAPAWNLVWSQLWAAGRYYKQRGKKVYAFLRRTRQWSPQDAEVRQMAGELGNDFIVRCPSGACDDEFMITFAKDLEDDVFNKSAEPVPNSTTKAFIVTNDLFRDHSGSVDASWVKLHTIKYTFVASTFVPQSQAK